MRKYTFSENKITALANDGNYIWMAFNGQDTICTIYKNSIFNTALRYWEVHVDADTITKFYISGNYVYGSLDHISNLGVQIHKDAPSIVNYFIRPVGLVEEAVDIVCDTTNAYFLIPGNASGLNAKIIKFDKNTLAYIETIDLTTVTNAYNIDIDKNRLIWVVSKESPILLTKVYLVGETYEFASYPLS